MYYTTSQDQLFLLNQIDALQQIGDFGQAATRLATTIETLLDRCPSAAIQAILARFPATHLAEDRHLAYVTGMCYAHTGQIQAAIKRLERARFSYTATDPQIEQAVRCSLALARLYCSREEFQTAYHQLHTHVQPWIEQGLLTEPTLCARFYLRMAELTPDIGYFGQTADYARKALTIYQESNDLSGQYFALVRLASALIHQGANGEAAHTIAVAKACLAAGDFAPLAHARVLNLAAHYHWYRGEIAIALELAQQYLALVDQEATSNFRVYARILLANLHRDRGCFAAARQWYTATRQVTEELHYQLYTPWIDAQEAWLDLLQGRLDQARRHIHTSLQTADLGQAMSFQVTLAVLALLEGELATAMRLLTESRAFYEQSGDRLAICTIHFYLALIAYRQGQTQVGHQQLNQVLSWLAARHIDYLPYWWHPPLLSEICAQALVADLYPDVVARIFLNHLCEAGKAALTALWHGADAGAAQRAYRLLQSLGDPIDALVAHLPDGPAKAVVASLLRSGQLAANTYPRLERELMTAMRRPKPNPTLIAVFGLYVNGVVREEIAERLDCSLAGVRNYITTIYEHFGVEMEGSKTRRARWQRLVTVVKERGFVN